MRLRLIKVRDALVDSFWFMPAVMAVLACGMAFGSVAVDHAIGAAWARGVGWIWSGGADGARSVLSVIAGSLMTVISIVFSLTISVLAQTSSHFGPRVLRNFTSDRGVQFTLGTFLATFVYSLLVLRTVRSVQEASFVPYLSINLGMALSLASLAVLIGFIHHVSQMIQAENMIASVGKDFQQALPILFPLPESGESCEEDETTQDDYWKHAHWVCSKESGYIQRTDDDQLVRLAKKHDLQIRIEKRPGDFVSKEAPLVRVLPAAHVTVKIEKAVRDSFSTGDYRTPYQDARYSIQQLVEIAAHALSPGINEPFTALTSVDWLGASLRGVVMRDLPATVRRDTGGKVRLVLHPVKFEELTHIAFDQIRTYGAASPDIMASLLDTISSLASDVQRTSDRAELALHARMVAEDARHIENETDRARVTRRLAPTLRALAEPAESA